MLEIIQILLKHFYFKTKYEKNCLGTSWFKTNNSTYLILGKSYETHCR